MRVVLENVSGNYIQINPRIRGMAPVVLAKLGSKFEFATHGEYQQAYADGASAMKQEGHIKVEMFEEGAQVAPAAPAPVEAKAEEVEAPKHAQPAQKPINKFAPKNKVQEKVEEKSAESAE